MIDKTYEEIDEKIVNMIPLNLSDEVIHNININ